MRTSGPDFTALEAFAVELARAAGQASLPLFRTDCAHDDKGPVGAYDPVTEADRSAERAIRALIAEHHPDHGIIGEEYGAEREDAEFVWVLDPVDGTRAFVAGLPLWTTLIALRHEGEPVVGVIAQPYLDEVFVGGPDGSRLIARGQASTLKTRACPDLSQAVIATTDANLFQGAEREGWEAVRSAARLARYGCDAYAYAMVALGRIDLVVESGLKAWDYEALAPVVRGAGGRVGNWRGEALDGTGQVIAAGDASLFGQAAERLSGSAK
jgi:histidinol phosphatase-like enzyme (inositol monophosphatase family)